MRQSRRPAPISSTQRNLNYNRKLQKTPTIHELSIHYIYRRYAESVIDNSANFDAIEVHGVNKFIDPEGEVYYEPDCDQYPASSYSVYAHLVEGGIDCCGDFTRREDALAYGKEISEKYGWPVNDFSTSSIQTEASVRRQNALLEMARTLQAGFREALCQLDPNNLSDFSLALHIRLIYTDALTEIIRRLNEMRD
jgi:hypothetical protein